MKKTDLEQLQKLGFEKNTKVINGFKPHFIRGTQVIFIMGADYWVSKIYMIDKAFEGSGYTVFGILTNEAPNAADRDWVTASNLNLIKLDPLSLAQWKKDGSGLEYVKTAL